MARQNINIGTAGQRDGLPIRSSFDFTNQNFIELYGLFDNYVPLTGTETDNSITGPIELTNGDFENREYSLFNNISNVISSITFNDTNSYDSKSIIISGEDILNNDLSFINVDFSSIHMESNNYISNVLSSISSFTVSGDSINVDVFTAGNTLPNTNSRGLTSSYDYTPNITNFDFTQKKYVDDAIAAIGSNGGQLEKIDEGNGYGYVIKSNSRNFTGSIGYSSVDLSESPFSGGNYGATGAWSLSTNYGSKSSGVASSSSGSFTISSGSGSHSEGVRTFARSEGEHSGGAFGTDYTPTNTITDRLVNYGNGSNLAPADAFTIYKNGIMKLYPANLTNVTNETAGCIIVDSNDDNILKYYDGSEWISIKEFIPPPAPILEYTVQLYQTGTSNPSPQFPATDTLLINNSQFNPTEYREVVFTRLDVGSYRAELRYTTATVPTDPNKTALFFNDGNIKIESISQGTNGYGFRRWDFKTYTEAGVLADDQLLGGNGGYINIKLYN